MLKVIKVGCATLAMLAALAGPAQAEMRMTRVSMSQSQGEDGALPRLPISPRWGLAVSFIKTGEQIQQVRVGDPSRIVTSFDSPLEGQRSGGASVIYLRQLSQPLEMDLRLPGEARHSNQVPMSVVTQSRSGLKFYQFQLDLGQATQHSAVEIVPDGMMPRPVQRPTVRVGTPRDIKPGELPLPPLESPPEPVQPARSTERQKAPIRLKPMESAEAPPRPPAPLRLKPVSSSF